jgi:hypothetical protein
MRLPRSRLEMGCRVAAFAVLGWLLGGSFFTSSSRRTERANAESVATHLAAWTRAPATTVIHLDLPVVPDAWIVDWLAALRHSNHLVTWNGTPPAVALSTEPVSDPEGGVRIDVAAPTGAKVILGDDGGVIDSARIGTLGATIVTPVAIGTVTASVGTQRATAGPPDSVNVRSVVVIGAAGWEGKFIVSALEERGWTVTARFSVAPDVDVTQGASLTIDTAHVSAVIAIDTSIQSRSAVLERFVRSGGGLVLAGSAAQSAALRALAPGAVGARTRPTVHPTDTMRLGTTGFYPVTSLNDDGVSLDRRADGLALAARRVGSGRVVQVGYDDSWRWRMAGAPGSERAHREWWSRLVASVAYVPPSPPRIGNDIENTAPLARLVDRIGPAQPAHNVKADRPPIDRRVLLALIIGLLIIEWGSRRLRGLR